MNYTVDTISLAMRHKVILEFWLELNLREEGSRDQPQVYKIYGIYIRKKKQLQN